MSSKPVLDERELSGALAVVLTRARQKRGLSQRQVAERINRRRTWLSKLEGAKCLPTLGMLALVAKALRTPMWNLIYNAEKRMAQARKANDNPAV